MQIKINTVRIESLSHDGRGVARISGKTIFVSGALPNEKVRLEIIRHHRRFDEAHTLEVLEASPHRVMPRCPHFEICGGCHLQHLSQEAQINSKQTHLIEQLLHFGKVKAKSILPPLVGLNYGYRRKARLGVRYVQKKEKLLIGFREKRSGKIADINSCEVLAPQISALIPKLQTLISDLDAKETIPQIEVAVGQDYAALVFRHLKPFTLSDKKKITEFAKSHPDCQFLLQPGDQNNLEPLLENQPKTLHYSLPAYNIIFEFQPLDFIQVNGAMNEQMIEHALTLLDLNPTDEVLDLFCGLGNFTLPIARRAKQVIGVEGEARAVVRATHNAQLNGITNAEFFTADLQVELQTKEKWLTRRFDKILLDPPRTGAEILIPSIAKLNPSRIVYVSCNPSTLARDVGSLVSQHGYELSAVGIMDMFPHTSHVESIALLNRK